MLRVVARFVDKRRISKIERFVPEPTTPPPPVQPPYRREVAGRRAGAAATPSMGSLTPPPVQPEFRREKVRANSSATVSNKASEKFDSNLAVSEAAAALESGERVVVLTGRAGTGKTTFIHQLRDQCSRGRMIILAPTGIAAVNVKGQTIHSFFKLPPRLLNPDDADNFKRRLDRLLLSKMERLVIDEISMVRADLLDAVDCSLRRQRSSNEPFGGVQVLLVGDFLQLPPVVPREEAEFLGRLGYETPYAFHSRVMRRTRPKWIDLPTVHRQTDPRFIEWLGNIRSGHNLNQTVSNLNDVCCRPHPANVSPILLCTTNAKADSYNYQALEALTGEIKEFECSITGDFDRGKEKLPAPDILRIRIGARVMALRNDIQKRWVNGSLGKVTSFSSRSIRVAFDHGPECEVGPENWEKIRYQWDSEERRVKHEIVGSFCQIPVTHAWALTIHKAQGLTLNEVRLDFGDGAFAPGQAYVALSRVRTLEGLSLVRPLREDDVRLDQRLIDYLATVAQHQRAA
jgi:hypothetical protein